MGMNRHTLTALRRCRCRLPTDSARAVLGRRVLETLGQGHTVPFNDAIQLRNWAVRPADILLPLAEIARGILDQEENPRQRIIPGFPDVRSKSEQTSPDPL